ncbi:MAG: FIST signal transduction protein [Thermoleophilaceae bacterium]
MTTTLSTPLAGAGSARGPGAVTRAVEQALGGLAAARPSVVVVFPSPHAELAADVGLAQSLTAAPVVGMTGNASLAAEGAMEDACSALALAEPIRAAVRVEHEASRDPNQAGRRAAAAALGAVDSSAGSRALLLFVDTRSGDQGDVVSGAYEAAGPSVPLAGGAAGGRDPFQIAEGKTQTDSVVAVALVTPGPIGVGIAHGCQPRSAPSIVTRASGRVVLQLDGRRAEDVYLEKLGCADVALNDDEFEAVSVVHPLAQPELSGDVRLRHVLGRTPDGGLICATHLPPNAAVEFTDEDPDGIVVSAWDGVTEALRQLGGVPPRAALVFDCAGRKRALAVHGETLEREAAAVVRSLGDEPPPLAGLYTHGEIGRVRGAKGDRNHAVVVVAIG